MKTQLCAAANGIDMQVKLAGTSLVAYLVAMSATTPTASRVRFVTLNANPV